MSDYTLYWCPASANLPTDVQALAAAPFPPGTPGLPPTLYAGTWGQGVYRSSDYGASWQPANNGISLPLSIQGGLAVDPIRPGTLYAGDYYGGGLYRSQDGALSWTLCLSDTAVRAVAVHPVTPSIVLVGDRARGIYRSADGGDSWQPISATEGLTEPHVRALALANDAAYAGAAQVVFYSADAGQSWSARGALPSAVQALAVHPLTPSLLYAGTFNHGLQRSRDGGASWEVLTNGLPSDVWVTALDVFPAQAGTPALAEFTLYAGTWEGQVYRSRDGGASWQGLGYLGYVHDVLAHPSTPDVVYAATSNNGVFRGSVLDHLAMEPVDSPQYVNSAFVITVTARDALGFVLQGFEGAAALNASSGSISPAQLSFADGLAVGEVLIASPMQAGTITVTMPGGPLAVSNPFDVLREMHAVYLPLIIRGD